MYLSRAPLAGMLDMASIQIVLSTDQTRLQKKDYQPARPTGVFL